MDPIKRAAIDKIFDEHLQRVYYGSHNNEGETAITRQSPFLLALYEKELSGSQRTILVKMMAQTGKSKEEILNILLHFIDKKSSLDAVLTYMGEDAREFVRIELCEKM